MTPQFTPRSFMSERRRCFSGTETKPRGR